MAFAMIMAILKMVILALIIGGLIFRTKQTVGLLAIGGILSLIAFSPILGFGLVAALITAGIMKNKEKRDAAAAAAMFDEPQPTLAAPTPD